MDRFVHALAVVRHFHPVAGAFWSVPIAGKRVERGGSRPTWPLAASALVLVLGTAPILSVVLYHVGIALKLSPILGPEPESIFFRMGLAGSYAAPVLITALALVGHAVRERSSGFALAGGLVLNAGATAAYLLTISKGGLRFDGPQWIRLAQLNAAVAACYALAWLAALVYARRKRGMRGPIASDFLLDTQVALAPALIGLTLGWAWAQLFWDPDGNSAQPQVMNMELADPWGWISLALAAASICTGTWTAGCRLSMAGISAGLTALAILAAVLASPWDRVGNWVSYNTLFIGHSVVALGLLAITWREKRKWLAARSQCIADEPGDRALADPVRPLWVVLQGLIIFALGVRELGDNKWWPAGGFAFLGIFIAPALAWIFQRRRYLYVAAAMINFAGIAAWGHWNPEDFVYLNVILLTLPVVPWLLIELGSIRQRTFKSGFQATPFHRVASRGALLALAIMVGLELLGDAQHRAFFAVSAALDWMALGTTAIAGLACLWDVKAKDSAAALYALGLVACGMLIDQFNLTPDWLLWTGNMVVAAYAVLTSYLWSRRRGLLTIADRLRIPRGADAQFAGLLWLVPCNLAVVSAIVVLTLTVELTNRDISLRVLAAQATLAQVVSLALLARGDRRGVLQTSALQLGAVGAVMFGWAWLKVDTTLTLLHALVVLAAALAAVAVLYGFGLAKLLSESSDWLAPARKSTPWLAALSAAAIVAILGVEVYQFSLSDEVQIAWPAVIVVAATLAGLSAAALTAAILPGRDPLGLSQRGRTLYVYAAEMILALLFVHIRLTLPWLFSGLFQQYWPLIVMAIAFSGVGFAEFCRRRKQHVLAEPLENTGALLPVLPVLGFWASDYEVHYSLLLLLVGLLYAGLSIARRSFGFGVLAALAANGGLWYFLNGQEGFGFLAHPQIWFIPPALCVLVSAYLNRDQMSESQMTGMRYFTSVAIYTSSTADIFLNGVAQAPWLPLVLAGISILGILAGIALRVRAFLFLGISFLVLALFTMVWHAAVDLDQTWIWWVSGIGLGILILALFGLFEKKRQEILEAVEKLKQWEG
ncbi:MAG: hypothetical protein HY288_05265 [Planctomycetia bacterium]|nr:hypothetical protein [Planctomycetia bacterium]